MIDEGLNELIELISEFDFSDKEKLYAIKDKANQYKALLYKNNNKHILSVFNDIPQMIDIAIEIPNDIVRKSCFKLIVEVLSEINNHYSTSLNEIHKKNPLKESGIN